MHGDKCLSIGDTLKGHGGNKFEVILTDCDTAVEWTEGLTTGREHWGHAQISANWKPSTDGTVCLGIHNFTDGEENGLACVDRCEGARDGNEAPSSRTYWDPSRNAIFSVVKNPDICLDADGDQVLSKLCSGTSKWKRVGPPGPQPPLPPKPLKPAPLTGNYSMFWPVVGGLAGIDDKGYPHYWGNNQAEACPPGRRVSPGLTQCQWPDKESVPLFHNKHVTMDKHVMTRSSLLQRALVWVAQNFAGQDYRDLHNAVWLEGCQDDASRDSCPQYVHTGACCSLPSNAWNISYCVKGPGSHGEKIPCDGMRPGDAISFGGSHVALFAGWLNETLFGKTMMNIYERKGAVRHTQRGASKSMICMRRKFLIEDVEPDNVPLALPREVGDDEEVQELDNPEPDWYNGECDHMDVVDYNCEARKVATSETFV